MKLKRVFVIITFSVILCYIFSYLGIFLSVTEEPHKADVIVVLAGDKGDRVTYGVNLYKEGYSNKLLFTGGEEVEGRIEADSMKEQALELGVVEKDVILEKESRSTYTNALFTKELIQKYNYKSAIIVTSKYHMRRARLVFNKIFKDTNETLFYCATNDSNFNPEKWWSNIKSIKQTISEYIKLVAYLLEGRL